MYLCQGDNPPLISVPAFQPVLTRVNPRLADLASRISRGSITVMTVIVAGLFGLYFFVFYPCPWYKIDELRAKADNYVVIGQWSFVEDIGQELCDCGALSEGWDWQAKSEYFSAQFRTAINFWRRAIKAQPTKAEPLTANIADAYIWLDDFKMAVDLYKKNIRSQPAANAFALWIRQSIDIRWPVSGCYRNSCRCSNELQRRWEPGPGTNI